MKLEVVRIVAHGSDIRELWLWHADGDLPRWKAGAHIGITLPIGPHGQAVKRHYSLIGNPSDRNIYRIAVLKDPNSSGGSRYIHEQVRVGHALDIDPPMNGLHINPDAQDFVLIAGGIGITPFYSMTNALRVLNRQFRLHAMTRSIDRLPMLDEITSLSTEQLHIHITGHSGRPVLAELIGPPAMSRVLYACGPTKLLQAIERDAINLGWSRRNIHFESFGMRIEASDQPLVVHLVQSGTSIQVDPGISILSKLLDAGAFIPHACEKGECGSCYTEIISGTPDHRDVCLSPIQRAAGMCPCVSWASSETLVLNI